MQIIIMMTLLLSKSGFGRSNLGFILFEEQIWYKKVTFLLSIPISLITNLMGIVTYISERKDFSLGIKAKVFLTVAYLCFLVNGLAPFIICFLSMLILTPYPFYQLGLLIVLIVTILLRYILVFVLSYNRVKGFLSLPTFTKVIHILANSFVPIPHRNWSQASKTSQASHAGPLRGLTTARYVGAITRLKCLAKPST